MNSADDSSRAARWPAAIALGVAGIVGFGPGVVGGDQFFADAAAANRPEPVMTMAGALMVAVSLRWQLCMRLFERDDSASRR